MHVLYLHGFASSGRSSKAAWFRERLARHGLDLHCPDFNEPAFASLTVTRMIGQTEAAIAALPPGPVVLIGSSLGAFVALHAAARHDDTGRPVDRLIFLAPAIDFGANRMRELGEAGLAQWRASGRLEVFHYAYGERRWVDYGLYEDARRYDSGSAGVSQPVLVVQGTRDESVDPAVVEAWARQRPNVTLHLVDDGHQLTGSLERIWRAMVPFLGLEEAGRDAPG